MGNEWIQQLKTVSVFDLATMHLGMQGGRLRTFGPCPACNVDRRGSADPRPPLGTGRDGKGWQCHACNVKGDAVELACLAKFGCTTAQMQQADWGKLHEWALGLRLVDPTEDTPRQARHASWRAPATSVSQLLGNRPTPTARTDRQQAEAFSDAPVPGRFGWDPGLAEACTAALWADSPSAQRAREYLFVDRKLSESSVKKALLGLYVKDGDIVINAGGRPYLTIPLQDPTEKVVNIRFRSVPIVGTCEHCQSPLGCKKCKEYRVCTGRPLPLYGAHRLLSDTSVPVLIVEGEFDVISMDSYGFTSNVVSGTAGAKTWPDRDEWLDLIEPYDSIIGIFDSDPDGEAGWKALAEKLGHYRTSTCTLPKKDAGDCLAAGIPVETLETAIQKAAPMHGLAFRKADEFLVQLETLIDRPELLRGCPTGSQKLDSLLGGWRPGVVVITGETGQGKTTFATWAMLEQARRGQPALMTSFEQAPIGTVQKLVRNQVGKDFTQVSREERADAIGILGRLPLYLLDHYGHIAPSKLIEAIRYAKRRMGVRFFLIDHLGFLVPEEAEDERRAIESVIRAMALVAKQMEVTIFLVVHPRNDNVPHSKAYSRITMKHIKGASAIRQDADDVLVVVVEDPDMAMGRKVKRPWPQTRVYADKVRSEFGVTGGNAALAYDPGSCTYADNWDDTPSGRAGLLVPRHNSHPDVKEAREKRQKETEGDTPRRRPPRGGQDAAAGDDRQQPLLGVGGQAGAEGVGEDPDF